jgi:glycosyltransferase involved in cell wall biosynthesis
MRRPMSWASLRYTSGLGGRCLVEMKVAQLGPYPPPHGGVQTNLVAIRHYLEGCGHSCVAVNLTRFRGAAPGVYYPSGAIELARLLLRLRVDILHLHFGGDLPRRLVGLALLCTLLPGRKTVLTFHSGGYPSSPAGQTAGRWTLRGFVFRRLDGLIAVNAEIADLFRKFGVRPERIRTILPFAAMPPLQCSDPLPGNLRRFMEKHRPLLVTVGGLEPEYDLPLQIDTLEDILQRFPDAGLVIAGGGSLEEELRREIASKAYADHVLLYGDLPRTAMLRAMLDSDVMLRTTLYDGDSISVREALYLGTPVIATDNGMRPPGVTLIPTANRHRLRDAVFEVLAAPSTERAPVTGDGQGNLRAVVEFYRELLAMDSRKGW